MVEKRLSGTSIPGSVFLIGLLIVAAIDISYISINWGPFDSPDAVRSVTLHQEYYTMGNALGLAKLYLGTGLRYSVYQAMYDNGYKGGLFEIPAGNLYDKYALWYSNGDGYPGEQELLDNLRAPALAGMGKYLESDYVFLDEYEVKLPKYTGLALAKSPEGDMEAKASGDRNLFIKRTMQNLDKIELEKNANLEEEFGKGYSEVYQKSLERLEEIKGKFGRIKELFDKVKSGSLTKEQEGSKPQITESEVFQEALKKAEILASSREDGEAKLKGKNGEILDELKDQPGEIVVQFETLEETLSIAEFKEQEDCTKQESQRADGERTFYKVIMTCTFKYDYNYNVKASVTDNSGKKYPVLSRKGEVSFEPLTFVFAAREGSR